MSLWNRFMMNTIAAAIVAVVATFITSSTTRADEFGTAVGSFNGVVAYSNGTNGYASGKVNYVNGYATGYKWQCVEYPARYYWTIYGVKIAGGNANTWYGN